MFKYLLLFVVLFTTQLGGVFAWVSTWEVDAGPAYEELLSFEDEYCAVDLYDAVRPEVSEEVATYVEAATFIPEPELVQVVAAAPSPVEVEAPKEEAKEAPKEVDTMKVFMLEFSASWCKYCKLMEPTVKKLKQENYEILTLDFDKEVNKKYVDKYKITKLPAFILVDADGKELARKIGFCSKETLEALFNKVKTP